MSNYTPTTNFTAKDGLSPGDPNKVVSGVDFDLEFGNIQTSNNTKVDTAGSGIDITSTTVSLDIVGLTNATPATTDEFAIYDASAAANRALTVTALADFYVGTASASGLRNNSGVFTLDIDSLTNVTPAAGDEFAVADASDSGNPKAVLFSAIEATLNHDSLAGFVANEHIDHSSVSITAGSGLTGGGTIAATRDIAVGAGTGITVNANDVELDISGLTSMTTTIASADSFLYNDGGTMKQMTFNQVALPSANDSNARTFADTDVGLVLYYTGTGGHTWTMPSGVGQDECWIVIINSGSGDLTIAGSGVTVNSANSLLTLPAGGMATMIRESSTVWFIGGGLQ